jgi:hypothetical protein
LHEQFGLDVGMGFLREREIEHPASGMGAEPAVIGVIRRKGEVADVDDLHGGSCSPVRDRGKRRAF